MPRTTSLHGKDLFQQFKQPPYLTLFHYYINNMKISSLASAMVIVAVTASVVQVATACSEDCKNYMNTPNTEYECAYIHPDCSAFHVGSSARDDFPVYYSGIPLTYGDGYYCNDGVVPDINNLE